MFSVALDEAHEMEINNKQTNFFNEIFLKSQFLLRIEKYRLRYDMKSTYRKLSQNEKVWFSAFAITHRFFVQAWEAILRHQIASFFAYKSSGQPFDVEIFALVLHIVTEILDKNR
jgi:hypothetical protein